MMPQIRTTRGGRSRSAARILLLALSAIGPRSSAQETSPLPPFDARRHVHLGPGVDGDYRAIEDRIGRLRTASRPGYRYDVVVVRSAGPPSPTATKDYADRLLRAWKDQAGGRGSPMDARSVLIAVALDNKQVAVHPGSRLIDLGLRRERIQEELIGPSGFIDRAREGRYPEAISALLDRTDRWIADHDRAGRWIPWLVGILLAMAAGIPGIAWLLHRRSRGRLDERIKEVRSRATDVMDRLDAIKERVKLLPASDPDFRAPMTGATAALYADIQGRVSKLWDRWLQLMESVDRAQKLARGFTSPFQARAMQEAERALEPKGLFEEIDRGAKACADDLDRLNHSHEAARDGLAAVDAVGPKLDAPLDAIRRLNLPVAPYQEEMAAIAAEADRARPQLDADPIGVRSTLEALRARGEGLIARAGRVAALSQEVQKLAATIEGLGRQLDEHRARGLRLDEEGGNPVEAMSAAERARAAAMSALRAGDPDAAAREIESAGSLFERAREIVEQVREARDYCRREQSERLRAADRLRAALPHAEDDYRRLEEEFAPTSWQDVRPSLDRIREMLAGFDRSAAEAAAEASDDTQRYLSAARRLRELAGQQQAALRLMSGISDRRNALAAVREECRKRHDELQETGRRIEEFFRRNDPSIGTMAMEILEQARRGRDAVLGAIGQPRPDWPSLRDGLSRAIESFTVARDQAEVDLRTHRQVVEEYERARAELERLADLLSSRREDRPAANKRFRSAAEILDRVGLDLSAPRGEWPRLLDQVRGAAADLERANRLAHEDFRLADQARSEIDEAIQAIDKLRGEFPMGIGVDTSAAEAAIHRANQLFGAQQYEQAIEGATQAQWAARRAHQEAAQRASWQEMQAGAERRRWDGGSSVGDAIATGAAVAAGVILANVLQGSAEAASPSEPASPPPEPSPSETSVTSWESDTGQGSW